MADREWKFIEIYMKDKVGIETGVHRISASSWDDYEIVNGLFVVKKDGAWVAIYNLASVICIRIYTA